MIQYDGYGQYEQYTDLEMNVIMFGTNDILRGSNTNPDGGGPEE